MDFKNFIEFILILFLSLKVNFMDSKIAYSDQIYNDSFLNEYYEGVIECLAIF